METWGLKVDWGFTPLPPKEREKQLTSLRGQIERHPGESLLVDYRWWEPCGGVSYLRAERYLGLIQPPYPYITTSEDRLTFDTIRFAYVLNRSGRPRKEVVVEKGNIGPLSPYIPPLGIGAPLEERRPAASQNNELGTAVQIVIGDNAVAAWAQAQTDDRELVELHCLINALGRLVVLPEALTARMSRAVCQSKGQILPNKSSFCP